MLRGGEAMANYLFQKLEIGDLFVSANRIIKEGSALEFILEKISEDEAVYRDDKGTIRITVKVPVNEPIIKLYFYPSYPHHGLGPKLPYVK